MTAHPDTIQVLPDNYYERLDVDSIFRRQAELQVDVGCGDGGFLLQQAQRFPELNFLGIERLFGRVRRICRAAVRAGLTNLRVLRLESAYTVRYLLPANSVRQMYILFPYPWPKSKHHNRRLINTEFLNAVHRALAVGGRLIIKTDHPGYAAGIAELLEMADNWDCRSGEDDFCSGIRTDFEEQFVQEGRAIFCYVLIKSVVNVVSRGD